MNQLIRIVAAVVDTKKAVLYKQDGSTVEILQGDSRLRPILEHITPLLTKQGFADVDLSTPNSWKEFEEKTSGTVRFFRIAKDKLKRLFGGNSEPVAPTTVGHVPVGRAIAGDHIGITEYVKITAPYGGGLVITPVEGAEQPVQTAEAPTEAKAASRPVEPLEAAQTATDKPVDIKKVAAKAKNESVSLTKEASKVLTQTDVVKAMWDAAIGGDSAKAKELLAFKKKAKKGWQVWGLPSTAGDTLKALLDD